MRRAAHCFTRKSSAKRPGAALLLVLGFVVLLSFLVVGIMKNAQREILSRAEDYARPELEIAARSALEAALAVVADFQAIDGAVHAPSQGWGDALALAGFEPVPGEDACRFDAKTLVSVRVRDESARFPLDRLSDEAFRTLMLAIGVPEGEIDALRDRLADWTDADDDARANGAEIDDYEAENAAAVPPNRALRDLRELRFVKGFSEIFFDEAGAPNALFRRLEKTVSPYASAGLPNVNTADAETLNALAYETDCDVAALLEYREGAGFDGRSGRVFRHASDLSRVGAESLAGKVSFAVRTLRVTVTASRGGASLTLEALVEISGAAARGNATPFRIVERTLDSPAPETP